MGEHTKTPRQLIRSALINACIAETTIGSIAARNAELESIGDDLLAGLVPLLTREPLPAPAGTAGVDVTDAERWRFVRSFLSVDGDIIGTETGRHVQWVQCADKLSDVTSREGWTHTVESLVDAALAASTRGTDVPGHLGQVPRTTGDTHPTTPTRGSDEWWDIDESSDAVTGSGDR